MTKEFEILKGNEKDFEGAPDWATQCVWNDKGCEFFCYWLNPEEKKIQASWMGYPNNWTGEYGWRNYVKAERRPITEPKPDAEGWIEWTGGECPVKKDTLVDIKLEKGKSPWFLISPMNLIWKPLAGVPNIIAYRLSKPEQPTWNGEGLPPAGVECEVRQISSVAWNRFDVVAVKGKAVFGFWIETGAETAVNLDRWEFRTIRSPEEIEREEFAESAVDWLDSETEWDNPYNKEDMRRMYDAGFRKEK